MSNIPREVYDRVHELALAIVTASKAGDETLHDTHRDTLRAYYDEQTSYGHSHPFLTEAMADYTEKPAEAVRLYMLALEQSKAISDEPVHTKMISLAERLIELGSSEQAEAYLRDGRAAAVQRSDTFWIQDADRLLQKIAV